MIKKIFKWIIKLIAAFVVASALGVALFAVFDPPVTPPMLIRSVEGLIAGEPVGIDKDWTDYEEISPNFFRAVVAAEDARFMSHGGVDWRAVEQAKKYNERHKGKKRRGASTITMQTARNTFLCHCRNYARKALEVYFTYLIEAVWGKKRIIEVYANVIEFGEGIYGVEAASQKFFGTSAAKLSRRQAALLAAVLPNPRRWNPARPTNYINRRASTIMARMNQVPIPKRD